MNSRLISHLSRQARRPSTLIGAQKRAFGNSVYLWALQPKLGPKASDLKQQFAIPKGKPTKIDVFDSLNP